MSKKNKIVYSNVQPNTKEAGVWVNTDDGNVKVEKDGKWVDDGGSSSGSGDDNVIYYKLPEPIYLDSNADGFLKEGNFFSGARGYYYTDTYFYGTASSIKCIIGARYSAYGYIDAFEFRPIQYMKSWGDMKVTTYNDYESLGEAFPDLYGQFNGIRITAEEYWSKYKDA